MRAATPARRRWIFSGASHDHTDDEEETMKRMKALVAIAAMAWPCVSFAGAIQESSIGSGNTPAATASVPPAASPAASVYDAEAPVTAKPAQAQAPAAATTKPSDTASTTAVKTKAATAAPAPAAAKSTKTAAPTKSTAAKMATTKGATAKTAAAKPAAKGTTAVQTKGKLPRKTLVANNKSAVAPARAPRESARDLYSGGNREGHFLFSFVGPGFAIANRGIGAMMYDALEGDYFFWEHLSFGLGIEVATDFKDATILSFVPHARYVWDLSSHPRWSIYAKAGVGVALWQGKHAAADIAIPGGGFWWQWTDRLSVGADTALHIYAREGATVGWTISPAFRYRF
jgi:hypothetical protein